ncbi:MAG: response regulator, partial [Bdellovibrionales bacterium]|nr:response regulator [Bdellovibrionales bacterium]
AQNGREGLQILRENWVDLVFLDINMPVMNGMEFMEELRKDTELMSTPVVVVSTEGSAERRARLEELEIKAYLRKPITPEDLVETVEGVLGDINHE